MISLHMTRSLLAVASLAIVGLAGPSLAATKSTMHALSKAQFIGNCNSLQGEVVDNGGDHAGCNLKSGTSVVCSFEPADSSEQYGSCDVHTRLANLDLRGLIGAPDRISVGTTVPQSLTSSESNPGSFDPGVSGGGKGQHAGGAGGSPGTMGDGGPQID